MTETLARDIDLWRCRWRHGSFICPVWRYAPCPDGCSWWRCARHAMHRSQCRLQSTNCDLEGRQTAISIGSTRPRPCRRMAAGQSKQRHFLFPASLLPALVGRTRGLSDYVASLDTAAALRWRFRRYTIHDYNDRGILH